MATSSILGGERSPSRAEGRDTDALGPSDSSDSGSDVQGERSMATGPDDDSTTGGIPADLDSDTDTSGTGERAGAIPNSGREGGDILPDRIQDDGTVDRSGEDDLPVESIAADDALQIESGGEYSEDDEDGEDAEDAAV